MPERHAASVTRQFHFRHQIVHWCPSSNHIEDANTNRDDASRSAVNVLYNQIEDE
jgi:hypothetical protein